jgi:S-adenosylmethionine hydrolase
MKKLLVLQSDFGYVDGAVAAMIGVALGVDDELKVFDLSHDITPFNIYEASYRLFQTVEYWPEGTVFVSIIDPGVGSERKSVVALTSGGHYIVTPDNGTLSHLATHVGIVAMREINEVEHRRKNTEASYTFHGRDVYAFTGAKLASGQIKFEDVGEALDLNCLVKLELPNNEIKENTVAGSIEILDIRFGSLWSSIPLINFQRLDPKHGEVFNIKIAEKGAIKVDMDIKYGRSFADVNIGEPVLYVNSLYRLALALNQGDFSKTFKIETGLDWTLSVSRKN